MDNELPPVKPKNKVPLWKKLFVLIPILFLSTWALAMWNPLEKNDKPSNLIEIGNYSFYELEDGSFRTYVVYGDKKIPVPFRLDPRNASNISLADGVVEKLLKSQKIYIVFSPDESEIAKMAVAGAEISRITGLYGITTTSAYTKDSEPVNPNIPIRTCADAKEGIGVIMLEPNATTGIDLKDGCVLVSGATADDLILAADKLGMNLLGIKV